MREAESLRSLASKLTLPLRIGWLAELEGAEVACSLPDAIGDRYLCSFNPLYEGVRRAALASGYTFSCVDTPLWRDYLFMPLATIDRILHGGVIPYLDNWKPLWGLMAGDPSVKVPIDRIATMVSPNHLLHESAHAVSHRVLRGMRGDLEAVCSHRSHADVIESILGEAMANAVEFTGADFEQNAVADDVFYTLNSYMRPADRGLALLRKTAEAWGLRKRLTIFVAGYFESNLAIGDESQPDAVQRVAAMAGDDAGSDSGEPELVRKVVKATYLLNSGFRQRTNPFYFSQRRLGTEYGEVLKTAWLRESERRDFLVLFTDQVFGAVTAGEGMATRTETSR